MTNTVGVTVLFTDIVGSTDLAARLGADAAERSRRSHFALVRGRIAAHGGTEVKNLGDGIMAVFPSSADALDTAIAIQQSLVRSDGLEPDGPTVRIGVAVGDCTPDSGDYFGEPVIVAARLCACAEPGGILVPDHLRHLVPRGRFTLDHLGATELKGLPEPIVVAAVRWEASSETARSRVLGVLDRLADDT